MKNLIILIQYSGEGQRSCVKSGRSNYGDDISKFREQRTNIRSEK